LTRKTSIIKTIKKLSMRVIILLTTIFLVFSGCRKYDSNITEKLDYAILQKQFFDTESTNDVEIKNLARDIKRQDSIFKFLPAFIQKNGIPKWDKVLYKTKNTNGSAGKNPGLVNSQASTFNENSSNTASQGVFFIPLQSTTSGEVKSYITAYKHNDSLYTYRLYNKDSLSEVHTTNAQEKSNLLNTEAVFGYFEKAINNKDSVIIGNNGNKTVIKNANIAINEKNNSSVKNLSTTTFYAGGSCDVTFEIAITYFQADYYINGYYIGSVYGVEVYMSITISCSGGGGGDCGCGNPSGGYGDPNGGYDPNNPGGGNWWNSGTGWPWNNPYYYAGYDPNNPNPYNPGWGWWWNGGGSGTNTLTEIFPDLASYDSYVDNDGDYTKNDYDNTPYSPFDVQTQPWPTISSVLSNNQFVEYDGSNCLTLSKAQIAKKGYSISGYSDPGQTFITYTAASGIDKNAMADGVSYLISALQRGIPVIVGVDYKSGPSPGNPDNTTDHFVVIVGMGTDSNGKYFTFFDNATNFVSKGASSSNKLYYNPTSGTLTGQTSVTYNNGLALPSYTVTQIRKSK
jgi:hypothetical protein